MMQFDSDKNVLHIESDKSYKFQMNKSKNLSM